MHKFAFLKGCFFILLLEGICMKSFGQCISTFPFNEGFELNDGNWVTGGVSSDWAWGSPIKPVIDGAGSGAKCWIIGGLSVSFYNSGEISWVQSPCFDFSALTNPRVSFKIFWETERTYDGANFQYSLDNGATWNIVGSSSDATDCLNYNWFNSSGVIYLSSLGANQGWSGTVLPSSGNCNGGSGSGDWLTASHTMPYLAGYSSVVFRFAFGAGTQCNNYDGFAFDDFSIDDAPQPISITHQLQVTGCNGNTGTASLTITGGDNTLFVFMEPSCECNCFSNGIKCGKLFSDRH